MGARCCKDREGRLQEHVYVEKEAGGTVIWVGGVRGLRGAEWLPGEAALQCLCVVKAKGEEEALLEAKGQVDKLEPAWNVQTSLAAFSGDGLEFSVLEAEGEAEAAGDGHPAAAPQLLARGVLERSAFAEAGFNGEVRLSDAAGAELGACLAVRIEVGGMCPDDPTAFSVSIERDPTQPLGARVDALDEATVQVLELSAGPLEASGLRAGDFIVQVNGVRGDSERLVEELAASGRLELSVRRPRGFGVAVRKRDPEEPFGLDFAAHGPDSRCLVVTKVGEGPVKEWGEANPKQEVRPRDRVVAVDGEEGRAEDLVERLRDAQELHMTIVRPCEVTAL
mmetsp:Transcript_2909/g.8887  ORF Transcript_2909/g.8887 Transcript_2909/m.8887 type:complete len:337 (+) Transcript_2909:62-1072(+)